MLTSYLCNDLFHCALPCSGRAKPVSLTPAKDRFRVEAIPFITFSWQINVALSGRRIGFVGHHVGELILLFIRRAVRVFNVKRYFVGVRSARSLRNGTRGPIDDES